MNDFSVAAMSARSVSFPDQSFRPPKLDKFAGDRPHGLFSRISDVAHVWISAELIKFATRLLADVYLSHNVSFHVEILACLPNFTPLVWQQKVQSDIQPQQSLGPQATITSR